MKKKFSRIYGFGSRGVSTLVACGAAAVAFQALESNAATSFSDLPDITDLTQLATFGSSFNLNLATVNGNSGVAPGGTIAVSAPSTINGTVFLGVGATKTGPGTVTGGIMSGANVYGSLDLVEAKIQLTHASSTFLGFTPDELVNGNVSSPRSFGTADGVANVQVFTINGNLSLSGNTGITFVGDPGDVFVLNVTGTMSSTGSAALGTTGQAARTILNLTGSGALGTIANINNVINGTILIPNATSASLHSASGAVYAGLGQISITSGGTVTFVPFVPEPAAYVSGALLLLPLGISTFKILRKTS